MTTTTTTPGTTTTPDDAEALRAITYAAVLRDLADAIADGALPAPRTPLRLYLGSYRHTPEEAKAAFLSARSAFPAAPVEVDPDNYGYVEIVISDAARLLFDKKPLGVTTTVTREVEEFAIDPAMLAPVSA